MSSEGVDVATRVDGRYGIEDLVDLEQLKSLFERFTEATGFTIGLLDHPDMNVLIATGWRDICTRYHRECAAARENCDTSNQRLVDSLCDPGDLVIDPCDNGLVDCAMPVVVEGIHVATLATGQVLLGEPDLDAFRRQAREFGIDEAEYLAALEDVPVIDEQRLKVVTSFLGEMALVISQIGYAKLRHQDEVAERAKAEERLRESEQRYRELFEGAAEGILVADLESKVLQFANAAACEMFGYPRDVLSRLPISAIHPDWALAQVIAEFEAQGRGEKLLASELPCLRRDGTVFHADISTRSTVIAGRAVNVGFFTDVTERRRDAEEMRSLEAQLAVAHRMEAVGRLAGGVAHDFNNLLSVIIGFTDIAITKTREGDPLRVDLQHVADAGERAATLTRQLLAFSRKQDLKLEPLDLADALSRMERILVRTIGEDVELVCTLGEGPAVVLGDRGRIEQVIMNLALNARDAMPDGGRLTLALSRTDMEGTCSTRATELPAGPYMVISVTDTGVGMDERTLGQIFEPFFTTKDPGKGTGLGLSTVYGTVAQCGGTVQVTSKPGEGSTFRILLPSTDGATLPEPVAIPDESVACGSEIVLVVEDDDAVRNLAGLILSNAGYRVHTAANGGEALLLAERLATVDILLSDVVMPRMNGGAVADRVAGICPDVKVLFMSGYTHDLLESRAEGGEVNFIPKPFSAAELTRKVRDVLDA